jgi:hypothetical protein
VAARRITVSSRQPPRPAFSPSSCDACGSDVLLDLELEEVEWQGAVAQDGVVEIANIELRPEPLFRLSAKVQMGEVTGKIKDGTVATVATGEDEIAIRPVSELVNVPGIDFVGPVPEELQYLYVFSAGIVAGSQQVDASQRLIHFLWGSRQRPPRRLERRTRR